ncbi:MAG: hypothetical protein Kow0090_13920 [Myxococcota bacterium]
MLTKCPGCQSLLKIPDEKISAHGTHLRCPKCSTVFMVKLPNAEPPTSNQADPNATRIMPNVPKFKDSPTVPTPPPPHQELPKTKIETPPIDRLKAGSDDIDLDEPLPPPPNNQETAAPKNQADDLFSDLNFDDLPGVEGDEFAPPPFPGNPKEEIPPHSQLKSEIDFDEEEDKKQSDPFSDFEDTVADFDLNKFYEAKGIKPDAPITVPNGLKPPAESPKEASKKEIGPQKPAAKKTVGVKSPTAKEGEHDFGEVAFGGGADQTDSIFDLGDESGKIHTEGVQISDDSGDFGNIDFAAKSPQSPASPAAVDDFSSLMKEAENLKEAVQKRGSPQESISSADDLFKESGLGTPLPNANAGGMELSGFDPSELDGNGNTSEGMEFQAAPSGEGVNGGGEKDFGQDFFAQMDSVGEIGTFEGGKTSGLFGDLGEESAKKEMVAPPRRTGTKELASSPKVVGGSVAVHDVVTDVTSVIPKSAERPVSMSFPMPTARKVRAVSALGTLALAVVVFVGLFGALWLRQARGMVSEKSVTGKVIAALGLQSGESSVEKELKEILAAYISRVKLYRTDSQKEFVVIFGELYSRASLKNQNVIVEVMMLDKSNTVIARGNFPPNLKISPLDLEKMKDNEDISKVVYKLGASPRATGNIIPFTAVFLAPKEKITDYTFKARAIALGASAERPPNKAADKKDTEKNAEPAKPEMPHTK